MEGIIGNDAFPTHIIAKNSTHANFEVCLQTNSKGSSAFLLWPKRFVCDCLFLELAKKGQNMTKDLP